MGVNRVCRVLPQWFESFWLCQFLIQIVRDVKTAIGEFDQMLAFASGLCSVPSANGGLHRPPAQASGDHFHVERQYLSLEVLGSDLGNGEGCSHRRFESFAGLQARFDTTAKY